MIIRVINYSKQLSDEQIERLKQKYHAEEVQVVNIDVSNCAGVDINQVYDLFRLGFPAIQNVCINLPDEKNIAALLTAYYYKEYGHFPNIISTNDIDVTVTNVEEIDEV